MKTNFVPTAPDWVSRESLPNGLDHAKTLDDIMWFDGTEWHTGITSETGVPYMVHVTGKETRA